MGFHIWDGLATLPYAGHTHAPPDTHFAEEQYMFHPTMAPTDVAALVNTQFGDRSPWSQVQVRPKDHPYRLLGGAVGVRVDTAPPGVSEASAKNGGITPVQQAQQLSKIKKRSLRRAIKRAQQQGHTVYRGRRLVAHPDLLRHTSEPKSPPASTRLECITWNVGGLTQVLMAELMVWLRHQPHIRAIMLQETHWSASCDWAADGWNFCHSASSRPRSGGVLVGLRQDTFARELIRWQEIVPGRLLHVRAFAFQQHVDLITVYQHALPFSGELLEEVMKRRNGLLKALDKHIGALPARSSVVIGGDLNSVLAPSPPNVGHGVHQGLDRPHLVEERKWLGDMLRRHGLCVLNSWRQKRYTYKHPNGKSQIDYLIVRKILADNQARNASAIDVPLAGWRTSGHFPVRASLKWDWRPWRHAAHQRTQQRTAPLVDASYQHPELTRLKQHLHQESTAASAPHKPQAPDITGPIKTYWQARARFKAAEAGSLRGIFERFRLHTTMTRAHRELRRAARARKVQQQQTILQLAEDAASKGDAKGLYRCVRWLSPKTFKQGIRLRNSQGLLMSPAEECLALSLHAKTLFTGDVFDCPEMLPLPLHMFTKESWIWALSQLRCHKAVPQHEPAVQTWKDHLEMTASTLARVSQQALCIDSPALPSEWSVVQLAWLPKPTRTPTCPEHLRSIGLLSADSKGFLLILRREITPFIREALIDVPQYAYRPQAGTLDALLRSSFHCAEVRDLLGQHRSDHTSKLLNEPRVGLVGGFMCSLDLAKAFDSVPHSELFCSMCEAGVPPHLAIAVMQVHCRSICVITHGGKRQQITMSRGLRQGCPVAPILYACWTVRLCRRLDSLLGNGWSRRHLSIFADDTHGSWIIRNERELYDSIQNLRVLIETLQQLGLKINYTKSQIVIQLRGQLVGKMQRKFFKQRHGTQCLRIQSEQDIYLPCVDRLEYLGTILSYSGFESQTALHRAQKADATYRQLRKPLRSRSALSTGHRVRLYRAIVLSSLLYGLVGVGVTINVVRKISSVVAGHMRKILRIYEHGISNEEVLRRACIDPIGTLCAGARRLRRSIELDTFRSASLKQKELLRVKHVWEQIVTHAAQPEGTHILYVRKAEVCEIACPECGQYFGTREGLSQHLQRKHPDTAHRAKLDFDREQHTMFGIPMCRFCHLRLHDWSSITKHIQDGNCSWVKEKIAEGHSSSELLLLVQAREEQHPPVPPNDLLEMQSLEQVRQMLDSPVTTLQTQGPRLNCLAKQCILCAQRVRHAAKIKIHWQQQHATAWELGRRSARSGAQSLVAIFARPCQFCGSEAKDSRDHAIKCPALFQFLAAKANRNLPPINTNDVISRPNALVAPAHALQQQTINQCLSSSKVGSSSRPSTRCARPVTSANTSATNESVFDASGLSGPPPDWILNLKLDNPGNHCYANASIAAILAQFPDSSMAPAGLRALHRLCVEAAQRQQAIMLKKQFVMRGCVPRWDFSSTQQDAVEFTAHVLLGANWRHGWWEARSFQDAQIIRHESGHAPICLLVSNGAFDLQDAVQAWHDRGYVYALLSAPTHTLLQLARYTGEDKNNAEAHIQDFVMMPVFAEALEVTWVRYEVTAALLHYGRSPHTGHYRSHLKLADEWYLTDDGVCATRQPILQEHRRNVYAVWVKKVEEPPPHPNDLS